MNPCTKVPNAETFKLALVKKKKHQNAEYVPKHLKRQSVQKRTVASASKRPSVEASIANIQTSKRRQHTSRASITIWIPPLWFYNRSAPARVEAHMACFASQYECWKKVKDLLVDLTSEARGYVVLEDDALIKLELPQQSQLDHNCITLLGGALHTLS